MRQSGTPTKYPGVYAVGKREYRVRGKVTDPRTGQRKEVDRIVRDVTAQQAARVRAELLDQVRDSVEPATGRQTVGDYARLWMRSKALKLDSTTAERYAVALEMHILPVFGNYYYDTVTKQDVQRWVDEALLGGWKTDRGKQKVYSRNTVHGWFRIFRTMTRDAMSDLGFDRDPTLRITFPDAPDRAGENTLTPEQLAKFLDAMFERYPHHFGLTVLLAFTGLRFCHGSALMWDDWDEEGRVIHVCRKQVRGRVGPVTRKKRAPRECPVEPELADVLRWHRQRLIDERAPGLEAGWMFPSAVGTLRAASGLYKPWAWCLKATGIAKRFTVHGMRYTFSDLTRLAKIDPIVRRSLTGHVTEAMQRHYSNVGIDEKRSAVAGAIQLVPFRSAPKSGDRGGDRASKEKRPVDLETLTGRDT